MLELKREEFEAIDSFLKSRKRGKIGNRHSGKKVDTIENEIEASEELQKNKMLIELNTPDEWVIKQIAVRPQTNVKCTTRFLAG